MNTLLATKCIFLCYFVYVMAVRNTTWLENILEELSFSNAKSVIPDPGNSIADQNASTLIAALTKSLVNGSESDNDTTFNNTSPSNPADIWSDKRNASATSSYKSHADSKAAANGLPESWNVERVATVNRSVATPSGHSDVISVTSSRGSRRRRRRSSERRVRRRFRRTLELQVERFFEHCCAVGCTLEEVLVYCH